MPAEILHQQREFIPFKLPLVSVIFCNHPVTILPVSFTEMFEEFPLGKFNTGFTEPLQCIYQRGDGQECQSKANQVKFCFFQEDIS